ncbi:MAG: translational GTPase TypA [Candidatus Harrisonbacteria bacterium]|nr:translational GTPase TypA [Candidatus Harrisonbacteria bacterium]
MKRENIRNIAIIAHVDHGKTTLVDAMLKQQHADRHIEDMGELIMDSMDQERERGITIKAKNASIMYGDTKINIIDTPGHADFGGEVERTLRMADGVLLLVDAKEGPMPQTRFVLKKALELGLKAIVVINKIDKTDARPTFAVNKTFDLFVELGASHEQLDFPIVYAVGIQGTATLDEKMPGKDLKPLFDAVIKYIPAPEVNPDEPLQMLVLALQYDDYKGKMAIGKIKSGKISEGETVSRIMHDGKIVKAKVTALLAFEGLKKVNVSDAQAGDIVSVAGFDDVAIGETIASAETPVALPSIKVEEPTVKMTFGVNNSPFAGKEGKYITSRNLRERLFKELETNVALRVEETAAPDEFLVSGRGELHLAVVIESMRREGYELQVSQPEVIIKEIGGVNMEPFERLVVEIPADYQGVVIEEVGKRGGELKNVVNGEHEVELEYIIPTRGLIGLKSLLMTRTKGLIIMHSIFEEYKPMLGSLLQRRLLGSIISTDTGTVRAYAMQNAQDRGVMFVGPGDEVYEGQVVGQNAREFDMELNPCKEKELSNMRSRGAVKLVPLTPPHRMSLEAGLEYIGPDELVEATPKSIRLRKQELAALERRKIRRTEPED